jgi:hypothetical protein
MLSVVMECRGAKSVDHSTTDNELEGFNPVTTSSGIPQGCLLFSKWIDENKVLVL